MSTMRAALLREFGGLDVAEVPVPEPGAGEALVRVRACGICGTDLKIVAGAYRGIWPPALPFIIGHEWSGEVAALGPGTERSGLAGAGARRIVSVNWHEGNSATLRLAAGEAPVRHGVQVMMAETHVITHTLFPDEMEFTHAGSMETAAVLAFDPGLVHLDRATPASDRAAGEAAHALFRRPDVYPVLRDFHQIAPAGWYGRPARATPGRAEEIAEAVADHVVTRTREIWATLGEA